LREKIDLAIPDGILDIWFNQNLDDLVDDEQLLHATYRVGVQVEKKKALKQAKEAMRAQSATLAKEGKKDDQGKGSPDNTRKDREPARENGNKEATRTGKRNGFFGKKGAWPNKEAALVGVPARECKEYGKSMEDCWRCGRSGYKTFECFSFNTKNGMVRPSAPW